MSTFYGFGPRYDVVIVGARCAGAALSLLLARSGAKVLVVDRQTYGSDTLSTHALMRGAILQLNRWGLVPEIIAAETPPIHATTFHYGGDAVRVAIKPEHSVACLYAPRRTVLDRLLVDAARNAGAEIRHGVLLTGLHYASDGRVIGVALKGADGSSITVHADLVVGADGRQSTMAQLVNAHASLECVNASGTVFGYFENLPQDGTHWYFAKHAAAGVIPTNAGHCVFAAVPSPRFFATYRGDVMSGFLQVLEAVSPELGADIDRGRLIGRLRGFGGAPGHLRQCHGPGWALVGDAGYFKDPLTAHGITDALRDAELLSRAIVCGGTHALESYQCERDSFSRPFLHITDRIASFTWDLNEVREHHVALSTVMKAETEHLARLPHMAPLAA